MGHGENPGLGEGGVLPDKWFGEGGGVGEMADFPPAPFPRLL